MSETLLLPEVQKVLERLHALADANDDSISHHVRSTPDWKSANSRQKATMLREALLPVSRDAGRFLYNMVRSSAAKRVVEFGTSFGISTIYFAAAIRDNGGGLVVGSELEPTKAQKAIQHLAEAGLSEFAEIRIGDALETLRDTGGVDLLFLDGWKELYLDVLQLMTPCLHPGSIVLADDTELFPEHLAAYLTYVRDPANRFMSVSIPLGDGIEYSVMCH